MARAAAGDPAGHLTRPSRRHLWPRKGQIDRQSVAPESGPDLDHLGSPGPSVAHHPARCGVKRPRRHRQSTPNIAATTVSSIDHASMLARPPSTLSMNHLRGPRPPGPQNGATSGPGNTLAGRGITVGNSKLRLARSTTGIPRGFENRRSRVPLRPRDASSPPGPFGEAAERRRWKRWTGRLSRVAFRRLAASRLATPRHWPPLWRFPAVPGCRSLGCTVKMRSIARRRPRGGSACRRIVCDHLGFDPQDRNGRRLRSRTQDSLHRITLCAMTCPPGGRR